MKWRFQWLYRFGLACCSAACSGRSGRYAQGTTNPPAGTVATNVLLFPRWHWLPSHSLSFGLDQVEFLCDNKPLGEPLWKYLASLIYILLAFYVAKLLDLVVNVWLKRLAVKTETEAGRPAAGAAARAGEGGGVCHFFEHRPGRF